MLRDFETRDQAAVRQLILFGMRERWREQFEAAANPDVDHMWSRYVTRGGEIVVWEEDGVVVGTGTLTPESDGGGRIVRMSVDRTRRRRGTGGRIVVELVGRAKRRRLNLLCVTIDRSPRAFRQPRTTSHRDLPVTRPQNRTPLSPARPA